METKANPHNVLPATLMGNGRMYEFYTPDPASFDIETIAHALSQMCRFNGHTKRFFSVAEHSVRACRIGPPEEALERLMHDAAEFVVVDLITPVKVQPGFEEYRLLDQITERTIAEKFGLVYPWPPSVKRADLIMLATELRDLLPPSPVHWPHLEGVAPLSDINLMDGRGDPKTWESVFLHEFKMLSRSR